MCSLLPSCAGEDIVVVVNAATGALVVALVARRGGRRHAFLVLVVRRRRNRRLRRGMSSSSPPLRLPMPGGACAAVMPLQKTAFLVAVRSSSKNGACRRPRPHRHLRRWWGCHYLYRRPASLHVLYLLYLDFNGNGPFPAKKPALSCAVKSPMVTIVNNCSRWILCRKN